MSAFQPVEPGYFSVNCRDVVGYSRTDLQWFGWLDLSLTAETDVHVGTGAPTLVPGKGEDEIVADMVRHPAGADLAASEGVIPGSSLKGAARAVFEVLTASCVVTDRACGRCWACKSFGSPGQRGRVGFDDAVFGSSEWVTVEVAQRYSQRPPRDARRFYRRTPERSEARWKETLLCVAAGSTTTSRVQLAGVDDVVLCALLCALGAVPDTLPYFRVGGGKNRGLGIVRVELQDVRLGRELAAVVTGGSEGAGETVESLRGRARSTASQHFRSAGFDRVLAELDAGYRS